MNHALRLFLFAVFALTLGSCGGAPAPGQCNDDGDCDDLNACIEGVCQPVDCLRSTDCRIREYCDERTYVCRAGCSDDTDCIAGESCDVSSNTCEPYACRDTQLDCAIGEFCSAVTGECTRDPADHCGRCEPDFFGFDPRGTCRDPQAFCLTFDQEDFFCLMQCELPTDCPRGFDCVDSGQDFNNNGRTDSVCIAYCPTLRDNGWL